MPAIRTSLVVCLALAAATTPSLAAKPLALSAAQEAAMGVVLATAKPASSAPLAAAPATVTPPLNGRRVVSSPFAGTVSRVHVLEGQTVKGGAPLVTLFSRDVLTISSELAQSQAELRVRSPSAASGQ